MNQDVISKIKKAEHRINSLNTMNEKFIDYLRKNASPTDVTTKIDFENTSLVVKIFGVEAVCIPRVTVVKQQQFIMEYLFSIKIGERSLEVTRFYLSADGRVCDDCDTEIDICFFNDEDVTNIICTKLAHGILESAAMAPS